MRRVVLATPNQGRREEVQRLLADIDVEWSRLGPPVPEGLDPEASARLRCQAVFRELGRPSFVENTALDLEGEGLLRGSEVKARLAALGEDGFCRAFGGRRAVVRVVVALAEGPSNAEVMVFHGAVSATVAGEPRGPDAWGWDRVLIPDGHGRTLAELGDSKYLVNMRHAPYLDLADHLRGPSQGGAFEAHVTVRAAALDVPRFRDACDELGVKCVLIELPEAAVSAQPMTASVHRGTLRDVQGEVHAIGRDLVARGFDVIRTKIEALPRNGEIPLSDEEAARRSAGYFEYHVKITLPEGDAAARLALEAVVIPLGARLSRNANARRRPGEEDRFLTLRVPGLGQPAAEARFRALLDVVEALPFPVRNRIREYTVYDSDVHVDRGWG
jgi:inosine/xanthosine triphosphate pyrophosphatase family protein